MMRCRWCNKEIEYVKTPIDNFWRHVDTRLMACDFISVELYAEPPAGYQPKRHRFKIVGKYRDPIPLHQVYTDDKYAYFVVYRCRNCGSLWKVERSWLWEGKMAFDPKDWSVCQEATE